MSDFEITGSINYTTKEPQDDKEWVKDWVKENEPLHVQAWDKDQGLLEERNDDLLGSSWRTSDASFKISFGKKQYDETLNFLREGNPDIYLIIRNKSGEIIHTTPVRRGVNPSNKKNLTFKITLNLENLENKVKPKDDPFSESMDLRQEAFQTFLERGDFFGDLQLTFTTLLETVIASTEYSTRQHPKKFGYDRYDGPIVPRYPWRTKRKVKVPWKK